MSRIRLILLDFDGTLVDTRRANARAYVETLREVGYAMTEEHNPQNKSVRVQKNEKVRFGEN